LKQPFRAAGKEPPKLHVLASPYRFIIIPIVQFILDLSKKHPDRSIVVVIPEIVEDKWYEFLPPQSAWPASGMGTPRPRQ